MKKIYQAPTVNVIALRHRQAILSGSAKAMGLDGFNDTFGGQSDSDDEAD